MHLSTLPLKALFTNPSGREGLVCQMGVVFKKTIFCRFEMLTIGLKFSQVSIQDYAIGRNSYLLYAFYIVKLPSQFCKIFPQCRFPSGQSNLIHSSTGK